MTVTNDERPIEITRDGMHQFSDAIIIRLCTHFKTANDRVLINVNPTILPTFTSRPDQWLPYVSECCLNVHSCDVHYLVVAAVSWQYLIRNKPTRPNPYLPLVDTIQLAAESAAK
jgi:hypothetical protein